MANQTVEAFSCVVLREALRPSGKHQTATRAVLRWPGERDEGEMRERQMRERERDEGEREMRERQR